jgi:septal ring factor EnvC (AmiA/AmiB activator)
VNVLVVLAMLALGGCTFWNTTLRHALVPDPPAMGLLARADTLAGAGDLDAALGLYEEALRVAPDHAVAGRARAGVTMVTAAVEARSRLNYLRSQVERREGELSTAREELAALREELAAREIRLGRLARDLAAREADLARVRQDVQARQAEMQARQAEIVRLQVETERLRADLENLTRIETRFDRAPR